MYKKKITLIIVLFLILNSLYSVDYFYYENLNDEEKNIYKEIQTSLIQKENSLDLTIFDFDKISKVFYSVINDNPQIFYVENNINYQTSFVNEIPISAQIQFSYKEEFSSKVIDEIKSKLNYIKYRLYFETLGYSNFEIVKTCFEYLCNNSTYDSNVTDQTLYSILIERKGVCASYAKAFKYLMDFFDIPNYLVEGKLIDSNEKHIWNMVEIEGLWYHVDVTQADSNEKYIDYSYLCSVDKQILKDHLIESSIDIKKAVADDYYYLDTIGCYIKEYDQSKLNTVILSQIKNNNGLVVITFENKRDYKKSLNNLIENKNLSHLLLNNGYKIDNIEYYINDYADTVIFNFENLVQDNELIIVDVYSNDFLENQIKEIILKGNSEIKLLFNNENELSRAKKFLFEEQNIFKIIEGLKSIEIVNYDNTFRFDILF